MDITFHKNRPFFEGVCIEDILDSQNTPFYLYSQKNIEDTYKNLNNSLRSEIFYAVKANSNQALLRIMKNCGSGADVVSAGELERSLEAGFDPTQIIFEGVGKSETDIKFAINKNIRLINVESLNEIKLINEIGSNLNKTINIGIRLNPDIHTNTIDKITPGKKTDKFGIDINQLTNIFSELKSYKHINIKGISCHVGIQLKDLKIFENVFATMKKTADEF
jgi:diaminopimelate decarboxylase